MSSGLQLADLAARPIGMDTLGLIRKTEHSKRSSSISSVIEAVKVQVEGMRALA